jgi:anti-sigma regulatory factor (Ser/Thr protein kinase)
MSERGGAEAADRLTFETTDPTRDKSRFFTELRAFGTRARWSTEITNEIELLLEEWWANLLNYAFTETAHPKVQVEIRSTAQTASIVVRDNGIEFDPVARPDPDLSIPVEERPIGGLGIYMIKKLSKSLSSQRRYGENILRIEKDLTTPVLGASKK